MSSSNSSLTGTDHFISLTRAVEMTTLYRAEKENILKPDFQGQNVLVICETFDRAAFDTLLAQTGCAGIRLYNGMENGVKVRTIVVGVNNNNEDMLPQQGAGDPPTSDNVIVEEGQPCPVLCPPASPLNGE